MASGFGGHGLNTTAMGGEIIAAAIVDGSQTWRAFEAFDLVWGGGVLGRAAVQVSYWYLQNRERGLAWLAPTNLPRTVLTDPSRPRWLKEEELKTEEPKLDIDEVLGLLASYSLITLTDQAVGMHRLAQAIVESGRTASAARKYPTASPIWPTSKRALPSMLLA